MLQLFKIIKNELMSDLSTSGSVYVYAIILAAIMIAGDYNFAWQLVLAAAAVSTATYAIKIFYYKPRPDNPKRVKYKDIFVRLNESSFPSLHSARITILALAFLSRYNSLLAALFSIFLIVSVGTSRIKLKRHYMSDVVSGILLGALASYLVFFA